MKLSDLQPVPDDREANVLVRAAVAKPVDVSPFAAFLTLRAQFGPPNSDKFDDTKTQWCYYFKWRDAIVEIYDWKLETWSIAVYLADNDEDKAKTLSEQIANLIQKASLQQNTFIARAAKSATSYVFQNPYLLYYETGEELLARATQGSLGDAIFCSRAAYFMFISAFEGLLNLIYEMYLKPSLRDERIAERLGREQIDVKVRLAPLYCDCFSKEQIDHESAAFKRFHSVINARNDLIHANLTKPMKRPIVIENDFRFIIEPEPRDANGLPKSAGALAPEDIVTVKTVIDDLVNQLLQSMKPRIRREFYGVLENEFFSVSIEDGEVIVDWE